MEAYPLSVRKKIIELYRSGESTEEIADRYGYCVAEACGGCEEATFEETGSVEPRKTKPGRKPALDGSALEKLGGTRRRSAGCDAGGITPAAWVSTWTWRFTAGR